MKKFVALFLAILTLSAICIPAALAATTGVYNSPAVHLRSTIGGTSIGLVNQGTTCDILGQQTKSGVEWYKVKITSDTTNGGKNLNGKTGWSQAKFIDADGSVSGGGIKTVSDAFGSKTLKEGSVGNYVRNVQLCLNKKGYSVTIDGDFGSATHQAVCEYQASVGLTADGLVGRDTKNAFWNDPVCRKELMDHGY